MSTLTLTQVNPIAFGTVVPPIQVNFGMKNSLTGNTDSVVPGIDVPPNSGNQILFQAWGPSSPTIDSLVLTGNFAGFPTHAHWVFHGTGNITGHGKDDAYNGTLDYDLSYSLNTENPPTYRCFGKHATASITYTE
jgi:hypothetical protein